MVDHCENCNCANVKKYCGLEKFWYIKLLLMCGIPFFLGTSFLVFYVIRMECSSRLYQPEYVVCAILYSCFVICYIMMYRVTKPFQYMGLLICWVFECVWNFICSIWKGLSLPTWSDIRLMYSMMRTIGRTQTKQEISISDNESNDGTPPPLPPKKRKKVEADRTTMFQKLTSKVSQGESTSTAPKDESGDHIPSFFHRSHSSKQSASCVESSRRRDKKFSRRGHSKGVISKLTKPNAIPEVGFITLGASSEVEAFVSSLTPNYPSDSETEQETSFSTEPHQSGAPEGFGYINIDERHKPAPTERVYSVQAQGMTSTTGDKQEDPDQTSGSSSRSTKKQFSTFQDFKTQSGLKLSNPTSSDKKRGFINAPISKFGTMYKFKDRPLSTLENSTQEQTFADVHFGSHGEVKRSDIHCQSSASYIRLPESESQSKAFGMRCTEVSEKSLHEPSASVELQDSLSQSQEQSSTIAFCGSQEQSRFSDIQKSEGNADQAAASYLKLPQFEKRLSVSPIRTEIKQSSPEQSERRDVHISLHGQAPSIPGIQTMQTYQDQTSLASSSGKDRTSNIHRRRSSRKYTPIPIYRKFSESESDPQEQRLNLQQPMQSRTQFSLENSQLRTSGIGEVHEYSTQETGKQEKTLREETSTLSIIRPSKSLENLRYLQQASETGFPETSSQERHSEGGHELSLSADYARKRFRGKSERSTTPKRRELLHIGAETPFREWNIRTKRTKESIESTSEISACDKGERENTSIQSQQVEGRGKSYLSHTILSISEGYGTQANVATHTLCSTKEGEDRMRQSLWRDPSHLKENEKQETLRKENFLTSDMATDGVGFSKEGAEDESEAYSSKPSFMFDQSRNVLDLSHIEVPLLSKHMPSKDKGGSLNFGESRKVKPILQSSARMKTAEDSTENTSQLSACDRVELKISNFQRKQSELSAGGYIKHFTLPTSELSPTQAHLPTTPINIQKEGEDRIRQQSSRDSSLFQETDKQTQRKETFFPPVWRQAE